MGPAGSGYPPPQLLHPPAPLQQQQQPHITTFPAPPAAYPLQQLNSFPSPGSSNNGYGLPPHPLQQVAGYPGYPPAMVGYPPGAYQQQQSNTVPGMKTIQVQQDVCLITVLHLIISDPRSAHNVCGSVSWIRFNNV